jgi:transcriptional regulator with XRE-family HTH domain
MERTEVAGFLRRHRAQIQPEQVGLSVRANRRTPGLRREEVAQLALISVDYYNRLEQARAPQPSTQVLAALARALRLNNDERDHLFHLTGYPAPLTTERSQEVSDGLLHLLGDLSTSAALVASDLNETLAQNDLCAALLGEQCGYSGLERSFTWRWFTDATTRELYPVQDHSKHSRTHVADLRATAARRNGAPDVVRLVRELRAASEEFSALWDEHDVEVRHRDTKRILNPVVGLIQVDCQVLLAPAHDQSLVLLSAAPGTEAAEQLSRLKSAGSPEERTPHAAVVGQVRP